MKDNDFTIRAQWRRLNDVDVFIKAVLAGHDILFTTSNAGHAPGKRPENYAMTGNAYLKSMTLLDLLTMYSDYKDTAWIWEGDK